MNIGKSLIVAAAALMAITSVAASAKTRSFSHEGVTYTYRIIEKGDKRFIVGHAESFGSRKPFSLKIVDGKVRGDVDGRKVAFATTEARAQNIQLAAD